MAVKSDKDLGINSWLEDELYQEYLHDRAAVDESWKHVFDDARGGNGRGAAPVEAGNAAPAAEKQAGDEATKPVTAPVPGPVTMPVTGPVTAPSTSVSGEALIPMRGAAARIAENMDASLAIPLATSQRTIPVKVIDENRRIINHHRTLLGKSKVSYTHIIGWAIVRALEYFPGLNHAYAEQNGEPFRMVRSKINLGIAVDVPGKDGGRNLLVPNIKNAGELDFQTYVAAFDDLVSRARAGKLDAGGFPGHYDFAHQSGHGGDDAVDSAADAGTGRDHRGGHHRLSRRSIRARRRRCAPRSASAR